MSADDSDDDPVGDFVAGLVDGMVTGYVLFVTFIDAEDGETSYYGDSMQGQPPTQTLGLAHSVVAIETEQIIRNHFSEENP